MSGAETSPRARTALHPPWCPNNRAEFGDGGGIYLQSELSGTMVQGNHLSVNYAGDKGRGLFMAAIESGVSVEVSHNLFVTNRADGGHLTGFSAGGIAIRHVDAWTHHNTFVANSGYGPGGTYGGSIAMDRGGSPLIEQNIIAYTKAGGAIRCLDPTTPTIRDNLVWDSVGGHGSGICEDWVSSNDNLEADPEFCDADGGDYAVASTSPALSHPAGPLGAFSVPGCSASPADAQTWNGIRTLYRP